MPNLTCLASGRRTKQPCRAITNYQQGSRPVQCRVASPHLLRGRRACLNVYYTWASLYVAG